MNKAINLDDLTKIIDQWVNNDKKLPNFAPIRRDGRDVVTVIHTEEESVEFEEVLPGDDDFLGYLVGQENTIKRVKIIHTAINHPVMVGVVINKHFLGLYDSLKTLTELYNAVKLIKDSKLGSGTGEGAL